MSQQADQIRDRRRAFAAPGSPLDKAVRLLAVALPALIGAVVATMLIAPLSPRGEVSFLLDRNGVIVKKVIGAAKANGTKAFFYEQEAPYTRPVLESAKISADYLSKLSV